jgi:drug/metabolite transporter (DMT)-like permease
MKALRPDVLGTAFILLWSSGYLVGAIATEETAPLALTMWRFATAAAVLAVVALARREPWPRRRELPALLGLGVPMFAVQFGALYTAMSEGLSAGTTALIACSSPLAVAAIAALAGLEGLRPGQWFGIGLGVVGVLVTLADRVARPPSTSALLWALLGLAGLALGTTLQGRVDTAAGPSAVAAVEVAAGCAVLAVWAPLKGEVALTASPTGIATFAWLALFAGVGAPLLLNALVRRSGATRASSHLFVVPAVTALVAWPLLGKPLGPLTVVGLVIVVVALSLATGRIGGPRRLRSPASSGRTPHRTSPRTRADRAAPAALRAVGTASDQHRPAAGPPRCPASGIESGAAAAGAR